MKDLVYKGNVVNEAIASVNNTMDEFSSLSSEMKQATSVITNARGFQQYVGGITTDSFSSVIEESQKILQELVHSIRQKQVSILAYSEDKEEIKAFLDGLSRVDYSNLDLSELNDYISFGMKASNIFKGAVGSIASAGLGLVEGIMDFGETGADLLDLGKTAILSLFAIDNKEVLNAMWEDTKARVSEKKVENIFNSLYKNTEVGQFIKNNAYGNETVRGIGKGLGYTAGVIGLNILTGGLASGGVGAAGSITAGGLAGTAGALGFANGTEEAWADGASLTKGLAYGAATGAWEGAQWYMGAKINQIGGLGDRIAEGIFKGAKSGVGIRIGLDSLTAATDAFARPALSMIYKDYNGATIGEKYKTAFELAGGWKNVASQAAIGAIASAVSEYTGARKLLKEAEADAKAREVFTSERRAVMAAEAMGLEDADSVIRLEEEVTQSGDFSRSTTRTIEGAPISGQESTLFRRPDTVPDSFHWFEEDGAYVPPMVEKGAASGIFEKIEGNISATEARALFDADAAKMSGATHTALHTATTVLEDSGLGINMNGLKLIVNHSEGNVARIRQALKMSYGSLTDSQLDALADRLAKEVFQSNTRGFVRIVRDDILTELHSSHRDTWERSGRLIARVNPDELIRRVTQDSSLSSLQQKARTFFGSYLPEDTITKIAMSDGYPSSIRKILLEDGTVPEYMLDMLSDTGAAKIFQSKNMARMKAIFLTGRADYDTALRLVNAGSGAGFFDSGSELLKATHAFEASSQTRRGYYYIVDQLVESGYSLRDATIQARMMEANALSSLGKDVPFSLRDIPDAAHFTARDAIYGYDSSIFEGLSDRPTFRPQNSAFIQAHYLNPDGSIDTRRLVSDFDDLISRTKAAAASSASAKGYDVTGTTKATRLFESAFIEAAQDPNNPNHKDALVIMSKMLELDKKGRGITIVNSAGRVGSQHSSGVVTLDLSTIDGEHIGTVFHESGHYLFNAELSSVYPPEFTGVREAAVKQLQTPEGQRLLDLFRKNEAEVETYVEYRADEQLKAALRQRGYSSFDDFIQKTQARYDTMSIAQRRYTLRQNLTYQGDYLEEQFKEGIGRRIDYKSSFDCAAAEANAMRRKMVDTVYRTEFGDYENISGMIDSATRGEVRVRYGHGKEYFQRPAPMPEYKPYHELIADYTSMRVKGDNKTIAFLHKVLGSDLMRMLEGTYRRMLQ